MDNMQEKTLYIKWTTLFAYFFNLGVAAKTGGFWLVALNLVIPIATPLYVAELFVRLFS